MNNIDMQENNGLPQLKSLLSRMMAQVDFMIRNDRDISQLDIDVMMDRTREFYDILCCMNGTKWNTPGAGWSVKKEDEAPAEEKHTEEETVKEEENHYYTLDCVEDDDEEEELDEIEEERDVVFEWVGKHDEEEQEEDMTEKSEMTEESYKATEVEFKENITAEENDITDDYNIDNKIVIENPTAEPTQPVTIGDILEKKPDNSIASQMQRKTIKDLRTAIGINEKFLFLNDLFKGSMEKYNKSLTILNEINNLEGAMIYMQELQVELQWDETSLAYKKLLDLVERKF